MRHFGMTMAALLAVLAPGTVCAKVITVSSPFDIQANGTYNGDFLAWPPLFDTSLGTLKREALTVSGTFTPGYQAWAGDSLGGPFPGYYPASVPMTFTGHIGIDGYGPEITLPSETANLIRADTGAPMGPGSPVPEPASLALLGVGLLGLCFGRRRR